MLPCIHNGKAARAAAAAAAGAVTVPWHSLSEHEALTAAKSSRTGLTKAEAAARLTEYGENKLTPGRRKTLFEMVWDQLYNIITAILLGAAVVAGVFNDWIELGFILTVVLANVVIGVVQEGRAAAATTAIASMANPTALVMRNGRKVVVDAATLVPGDMVALTAGDRVPCDVRLLETVAVRAVEAALTGESMAVNKTPAAVAADAALGDRFCIAFMGTLILDGDAMGLVIATGDRAEIGRINALMSSVEATQTPLQAQIASFGFTLSIMCLVVAIAAFLIAKFGRDRSTKGAFEVGIGVAVALIPEGLPTVVTITLALGVQTMAKANAVIRQLPAVETLGALTCICSDKTGTLTKNEMTAVVLHTAHAALTVTGSGYNPHGQVVAGPAPNGDTGNSRDGEAGGNEAGGPAPAPLDPDTDAKAIRQLLLPAMLCNDATLMPVISALAHEMLSTEPLVLPNLAQHAHSLLSSSSLPPALAAALGPAPAASANTHGQGLEHSLSHPHHSVSGSGDSDRFAAAPPVQVADWYVTGDPTEAALVGLVMKAGVNFRTLHQANVSCRRLAALPFSSVYKFMATLNYVPCTPDGPQTMLYVKGAPDVLLARCATQAAGLSPWTSEPLDRAYWTKANTELAQRGMRVLALCQRAINLSDAAQESGARLTPEDVLAGEPALQLNALVAIVDPPRDEAITAVRSCHAASIMVKMITGDHAATAKTIGEWLGIKTAEVLTGPQLQLLSDAELETRVDACNIYARASPEHKLRIVRALQKRGHVVAMTGDGVNDGPALRQADVGVAMGIAGTEVAREAARMVLQDDNFATIEVAVKLGRTTYDNLRKLLLFLLPTSVAQGFSVAAAIIIDVPTPLTPIQILFVNMITAATLGLVLASEPPEDGIMARPPRRAGKRLLGKFVVFRTVFVGMVMVIAIIGQYAWSRKLGHSEAIANTMAFNTLVVMQCFYCLSCRFLSKSSVSIAAVTGNRWLSAMILLNILIQCLLTYTPGIQSVWQTSTLNGVDWLRILLFAVAVFALVEIEKRVSRHIVHPFIMPVVNWLERKLACCFCCRSKTLQPVLHTHRSFAKSKSSTVIQMTEIDGFVVVEPLPTTSAGDDAAAGVAVQRAASPVLETDLDGLVPAPAVGKEEEPATSAEPTAGAGAGSRSPVTLSLDEINDETDPRSLSGGTVV